MKYLENDKYNKIKELASQGDEKAKDFLFNFMDLSEEEANDYLSGLAVGEEKDLDFKKIIKALIDDENEAIDGYDRAIKYVTNSEMEDKEKIIEVLQHIKEEELEHIEELKEME